MESAPHMLTEEEAYALSTPEEQRAINIYRMLQREAQESGVMGETALLMAGEAISTIVARNKRLGLIP